MKYSILFAFPFMLSASGAVVAQPNVVFIISDDQAYGDYGFMGNQLVHTPSLDWLATEGILPGLSPSLPSTRSCSESLPTPNHTEGLSCIRAPL